LHVSIRQTAYACQAGKDKHQQDLNQQAFIDALHGFARQACKNAGNAWTARSLVCFGTGRCHASIPTLIKAIIMAPDLSKKRKTPIE